MMASRAAHLAMKKSRTRWIPFLITCVLPFAGCAVGPKYKGAPPVPTPLAYKELGNWKTAQPSEQNLGGSWWEIFQDPQLNSLEEQINVSNQNLKQAIANYQQSRAALRYARSRKTRTRARDGDGSSRPVRTL